MQIGKKGGIRTRGKFHSHPDAHWHASVVDNMQRRHLLVLFSQYEKQLKQNENDSFRIVYNNITIVINAADL